MSCSYCVELRLSHARFAFAALPESLSASYVSMLWLFCSHLLMNMNIADLSVWNADSSSTVLVRQGRLACVLEQKGGSRRKLLLFYTTVLLLITCGVVLLTIDRLC